LTRRRRQRIACQRRNQPIHNPLHANGGDEAPIPLAKKKPGKKIAGLQKTAEIIVS
jgi:hypothetical protein